jgi:hypothetical protein
VDVRLGLARLTCAIAEDIGKLRRSYEDLGLALCNHGLACFDPKLMHQLSHISHGFERCLRAAMADVKGHPHASRRHVERDDRRINPRYVRVFRRKSVAIGVGVVVNATRDHKGIDDHGVFLWRWRRRRRWA